MKAAGYVRVSTEEQGESGASLKSQRQAIAAEAERRGWHSLRVYSDIASGRTVSRRHGLQKALQALENGRADILVVAKLDRLSRSLVDFAALLDRARKRGWALVALDLGVDTTTPAGELCANVMVSVAQWERQVIGERTKTVLAVKKAEGVRLGRPSRLPEAIRRRIARMRDRGLTFRAIADRLNAEDVPTTQGGRQWYPATVRKIVLGAAPGIRSGPAA